MVIVKLGVQTGRHVALDRLYIMLKPTLPFIDAHGGGDDGLPVLPGGCDAGVGARDSVGLPAVPLPPLPADLQRAHGHALQPPAGRVGESRQGPPQADARHNPIAFRILTHPSRLQRRPRDALGSALEIRHHYNPTTPSNGCSKRPAQPSGRRLSVGLSTPQRHRRYRPTYASSAARATSLMERPSAAARSWMAL